MSNCNDCDDLCRNLSLLTGDKGDAGANGLDGTFGANSDLYIFSTATVGNPTNTKLIFDNANVSAATSISVSNVDGYGNTVSGWLNLVGTSNATLKAFIRVNKEFDSTAFAMYAVTAQTANAGYYTYTVTYVGGSSNSPFALNDNVIFSYVISGNNGAAGTSGTTIVFNQFNLQNTLAVGTQAFNLDIPANTLVGNGDIVEFEADILVRVDTGMVLAGEQMSIVGTLNGVTALFAFNPLNSLTSFMPSIRVSMTVSRTTLTTGVETQGTLGGNPVNALFRNVQNGAMDFTLAIPFSISFINNLTNPLNLAATPFAIITRATMKYIPA